MTQKKVTDFINGEITYDKEGQYFWVNEPKGGVKMLAELRGWGAIQSMYRDKEGNIPMKTCEAFQDEIGEWIADAINQKLQQVNK